MRTSDGISRHNDLLTLVCAWLLVSAGAVQGQVLSELVAVAKGDLAALELVNFGSAAWESSAELHSVTFWAYYDRGVGKVIVELYGITDQVPAAGNAIACYRQLISDEFIPWFRNQHNIPLAPEQDLRIVYRARLEEGRKKVLVWDGGKLIYPVD